MAKSIPKLESLVSKSQFKRLQSQMVKHAKEISNKPKQTKTKGR